MQAPQQVHDVPESEVLIIQEFLLPFNLNPPQDTEKFTRAANVPGSIGAALPIEGKSQHALNQRRVSVPNARGDLETVDVQITIDAPIHKRGQIIQAKLVERDPLIRGSTRLRIIQIDCQVAGQQKPLIFLRAHEILLAKLNL